MMDFHDHLEACKQCADQPFELCPEGARLIQQAAEKLPTAHDVPDFAAQGAQFRVLDLAPPGLHRHRHEASQPPGCILCDLGIPKKARP